jgi:hypothetical protein
MAYIGDGTINNPYLIDNITDFGIVLANSSFGGTSNTRYIKLIADLEFNTMGLIGDYIFSVAGLENNTINIDGDGHWIRNHTRFYNNVLYGNYYSKIIFNNIKMSIYDLSTSTLPFIQIGYPAQQIHFNRCVLYIYSTNPNGIVFHANTVAFSSVLLRFNLSYIKIKYTNLNCTNGPNIFKNQSRMRFFCSTVDLDVSFKNTVSNGVNSVLGLQGGVNTEVILSYFKGNIRQVDDVFNNDYPIHLFGNTTDIGRISISNSYSKLNFKNLNASYFDFAQGQVLQSPCFIHHDKIEFKSPLVKENYNDGVNYIEGVKTQNNLIITTPEAYGPPNGPNYLRDLGFFVESED